MMLNSEVNAARVTAPISAPLELSQTTLPKLLEHYDVDFIDRGESVVASKCFCFARTELLPTPEFVRYGYRDGELFIDARVGEYPGLKHRRALTGDEAGEGVLTLRKERVEGGAYHRIGAPFPPSIGTSGRMVELFGASGDVKPGWISAREIVTRYLNDRSFNVSVSVLTAIGRLGGLRSAAVEGAQSAAEGGEVCRATPVFPLLSYAEVLARIAEPELTAIAKVRIAPAACEPAKPFLKLLPVPNSGGAEWMVIRPQLDAVDVCAFFMHRGEPWMVAIRSIRPAKIIAELNGVASPVTVASEFFSIGGVAESFEPGDRSEADIVARACAGVEEEVGVTCRGPGVYLGSSFADPSSQLERLHNVLVEIDPASPSGVGCDVDERVDLFATRAADIVALADAGVINDPRLELNARLLIGSPRALEG
jgi:hypothetical protein